MKKDWNEGMYDGMIKDEDGNWIKEFDDEEEIVICEHCGDDSGLCWC